jgi:phosphatidylglycerophosphate synthase
MVELDQAVKRPLLSLVPSWIHPNHFTILRALLLFPLILARNIPWLAVSIVLLSSVCDLFDGLLARVRGQTSETGASLDAFSDKFFLLGALIFACGDRVPSGLVNPIVALDVLLTILRPIKKRLRVTTKSNKWGAAKTWSQTAALVCVLSGWPWLGNRAYPFFGLAIFFALLSFRGHLQDFSK